MRSPGVGIESSSFRNGTPHESVCELEILTGDGRIVVARPDNDHRDLFYAFPNSYGTLGYALRLEIELEPVKPFVALRHLRFGSPAAVLRRDGRAVRRSADARTGVAVDFVDGTVFSGDELYLTVGTFVDAAPYLSDYTYTEIYYRSIQRYREDYLTTRDYLWRWDTDWFWCSRAFGVQKPVVRRLMGRRLLRSDVYWKIVAFERRYRVNARLERAARAARRARTSSRTSRSASTAPRSSATSSCARSRSRRSGCARCSSAGRRDLAAVRVRPPVSCT